MRELTNECPKPMLPVQGKPILQHIIEGLRSHGVTSVFIVTGFRADVIENHFRKGDDLGVKIEYGRQLVQDGTGKAPELAKSFVGPDSFLLTYGDILVRPETYGQMFARFGSGQFSGLVTVTGSQDVTKGGLNFFDAEFCLRRVVEKPTTAEMDQLRLEGWLQSGQTAWYNAGIYVFRPVLFEFTSRLQKTSRGEYELTEAVNQMVDAGHRIAGMEIAGRWVDVRDPEVLAELEKNA